MHSLAATLDYFNRKERNLLVRAILGREEEQLPLSERFRNQVANALDLKCIPVNAWWATDYHISWLAGALALFVKGDNETTRKIKWPNPKNASERRLVEGNQEDIDLVIAAGCNLILIEAKGFGYFGNAQLTHKLTRLELLHDFYGKLVGPKPAESAITFHFLLISPTRPSALTTSWPSWACKGQDDPWIELEIDKLKSVFRVTRCDKDGKSSAGGECWCIKQVRRWRFS
jgi:hypothetical protein